MTESVEQECSVGESIEIGENHQSENESINDNLSENNDHHSSDEKEINPPETEFDIENGMKEIDIEEVMEDIPVDEDKTNGLSGNIVVNKNADISIRVQSFKDWGYNTFMRTKQKVKEKLSRSSRTEDKDLEDRIDIIRLQQTQYKMMLSNNNRMVDQLKQNILVHQYSSRMFSELAQSDKVLSELFLSQSQSELSAATHFRELIDRLVLSTKTLETLVTKTFDDMFHGIEAFETARVEYDAFKTETVKLVSQMQQQKNGSNPGNQNKLQEMQEILEQKRQKYESSKASVLIKMELLEDNKVRVMQREVLNFRHAWFSLHSSCLELYSGNKTISLSEAPQDNETQ